MYNKSVYNWGYHGRYMCHVSTTQLLWEHWKQRWCLNDHTTDKWLSRDTSGKRCTTRNTLSSYYNIWFSPDWTAFSYKIKGQYYKPNYTLKTYINVCLPMIQDMKHTAYSKLSQTLQITLHRSGCNIQHMVAVESTSATWIFFSILYY
jgi:hypothetical protein